MTARQSAGEAFSGGVAVITGAGSGIGEGIARTAAALGMTVVLADIAADRISALAEELRASGAQALPVPTDVTDAAALDNLAAVTFDTFGDVRLLVNNAGIEMLGHVWEIPAATWDKALSINVMGVIHGVRAFAPRMLAAEKPAWIANLSSVGGLGMMPIQTPYIVSKHAVLSFTECLAMEIEMTGKPISVSAVLPGPVATRIFDDAPVGDNPSTVDRHRAHMQAMLRDYGITGLEAGRRILDGLAAGDFWVSTHPEMTAQAAAERAEYLKSGARPHLTEMQKSILG